MSVQSTAKHCWISKAEFENKKMKLKKTKDTPQRILATALVTIRLLKFLSLSENLNKTVLAFPATPIPHSQFHYRPPNPLCQLLFSVPTSITYSLFRDTQVTKEQQIFFCVFVLLYCGLLPKSISADCLLSPNQHSP